MSQQSTTATSVPALARTMGLGALVIYGIDRWQPRAHREKGGPHATAHPQPIRTVL